MELLPNRVISTVVSPAADLGPERQRGGRGEWGGTPGTAAAAARSDIQGWLIYGAGETLPLLWVSVRGPWQLPPPLTYSIIKPGSQESPALVCGVPDAAAG